MTEQGNTRHQWTLTELVGRLDTTRCWWGIFAGAARCPYPASYRHKPPDRDSLKPQNRLLVNARWCHLHKHLADVKILEG